MNFQAGTSPSQGGRWTLIISVLFYVPLYLLQVLKPPDTVIKLIESIMAKFLWGTSNSTKGIHWTRWKNVCLPVNEGGLNIRSLKDMCSEFAAKLWFKFREMNSLWANFLYIK